MQMTRRVPFSGRAETEVKLHILLMPTGLSKLLGGWVLGPGGDEVVLPLELGLDVGNRRRTGCGLSKATQLAQVSCSPGPVPLTIPQGEGVVERSPGTGTLQGHSPGEQSLGRAAPPLTKNTPRFPSSVNGGSARRQSPSSTSYFPSFRPVLRTPH